MRNLIQRARPAARTGATLPELLVALVLLAIVAGAMVRALDRQARFHDGLIRLLEARGEHSATHDAVAAEIRGASTAAGELDLVTDSSVSFRTHVASAMACAISAAGIDLAPGIVASGQRLSHVSSPAQMGDTAWLFDEGPSPASADDAWVGALVVSLTRLTGACAGTPYVDPVLDAGRAGWRLALALPGLPAGFGPGSAVRLTRRARLALYRTAAGDFALGYADWNGAAAAWNVIQPVTGSFAPHNRTVPAASGLTFQALDSTGAVIAAPVSPAAARLSLKTRSVTRGPVRMDGRPRGARVDSLSSTIALRNRP